MKSPTHFTAIGLAGGGNRCYWQSGFLKAFSEHNQLAPDFFVGLSAGVYHGAMHLAGVGDRVRSAAFAFTARKERNTDWSKLKAGKSPFLLGDLFRQFLAGQFGEAELATLKQAPPLLIQLSALPARMPGALAALGSISAYQIEKAVKGGIHSSAGKHLGLKPVWISTHDLSNAGELVDAIMATSSVPPFMPVGQFRGAPYLDGGLVDNPPLAKLREVEAQGGKTLLLTTRHGRKPPEAANRIVIGPSEVLPVDKFSIDDEAGLRHAFEMGLTDGLSFVRDFAAGH